MPRSLATATQTSWRFEAQSAVPVAGQPDRRWASSSTAAEQHRQHDELDDWPWRCRRSPEAMQPARTREVHLITAGVAGWTKTPPEMMGRRKMPQESAQSSSSPGG